MKRLIVALNLAAFTCLVFGQGEINFLNNSSTLIIGMDGSPAAPAGTYYFGLFIAPVGTTTPNAFTFTGCYATNVAVAGRIFGGNFVPVTGWPAGTAMAFMVRGWPASLGHDWNPGWLQGGVLLGTSMIATGNAGGWDGVGNLPPVNLFGSTAISSGFMIWACLGPYWMGFAIQPTNQSVVLGGMAVFEVYATACPPPAYQWFFNGNPIPGANKSYYQISNVHPSQAGNYAAVLSNPLWPPCCGTNHTSASASLTVLVPPAITSGPSSQTAEVGARVRLAAVATGDPPLLYQWTFNGTTLLSWATRPVLELEDVALTQSGSYTVAVTNAVGAVTSAPAMVNIIVPVERRMVPGVVLSAQPDSRLNVEWSSAVGISSDWTTISTVYFTNSPQYFFDLSSPPPSQRYYRASQIAPVSITPSLNLHLIPALTLTGSIGNQIRVDGINQIGPTDAWFTLATVTLTNTSQLFFDVSAPGQPQRLYRLVPVP